MGYTTAQEYADIYNTQAEFDDAQRQGVRDAILSLAPFTGMYAKDSGLTKEQASAIKDKIGILQGQLLLVDALVADLGGEYKKFLAAHP